MQMKKVKSVWYWLYEFLKKYRKYVIFFLIIAIGVAVYFSIFKKDTNLNEEYIVKKGILEEVTSMTGRVKATEEADVTFEKAGVVNKIYVDVGEKVSAGQILAKLSNEDTTARVAEAYASYQAQKSILDELKTGGKTSQIDIKKSVVEKSQSDILQAYRNAGDSIRNISIAGNSYVRESFSSQFTGDRISGYKFNVSNCDSLTESKLNNLKMVAEDALLQIEDLYLKYDSSNQGTQSQSIIDVKNNFVPKIFVFLNTMKDIYSGQCMTVAGNSYDPTRLAITTGRNTLSTLSNDLSTKLNLIYNSKIALTQAESDLTVTSTGEKDQKISTQGSQVNASFARYQQAVAESNKNILRSPFNGIVTNVDIKEGELASVGGKSISLISGSTFEIESRVSEVDVAKLEIGDKAEISFDAYAGDVKFEAVVSNISPAGIISEGVPTYKTIFSITSKDERIRSGMTANIKVITNILENVFTVPVRAITKNKEIKSLKIKNGNSVKTMEIKTGILGKNGEIEILEGLKDDDVVLIGSQTK